MRVNKLKIKQFFEEYFDKSDLQWILKEKLGLPYSGNIPDLIDRIVENEKFHPDKLFEWICVEDLKDICRLLKIKV